MGLIDLISKKKMWGWHPYLKGKYYKNIDDAKNDIERIISNNNKQYGQLFGHDDPNEIINLYNYIETNRGIKIEPKVKPPKDKKPPLEYLTDRSLAQEQKASFSDVYGVEFGRNMSGIKYINTTDSRIYGTEGLDEKNVTRVVNKIKNGDNLHPILLDYDYGIIDGHHR